MRWKRVREQRWLRVLSLAVVLLSGVVSANVVLHGNSREHQVTLSQLTELNTLLHEESSLPWKTLASRGSPILVSRDLGEVQTKERALVASLSKTDLRPEILELTTQIAEYHDVLDRELGLLGVGKSAEALELETRETDPRFARVAEALHRLEVRAAASADRDSNTANVTLIIAMVIVSIAIGVLLYRFEREHRATNKANQEMLHQQRLAMDTLAENEALISHQASHDSLTGLPNRRLLTERIDAACQTRSALLLVDLDDFKPVNDTFGHAAGDDLLVGVAGRLLSAVRAGDTVARLGGDEFAVVVLGDVQVAVQVAARIVAACAEPFAIAGNEVLVGASIGVAVNDDGCDGTELLRRADMAMYDVKRGRKGSYAMYEAVPELLPEPAGNVPQLH